MATQAKLDLYKEHKAEYVTPKQPVLLNVKPAKYLTVTGQGAPGGKEFQAAVGALYGVAFTMKMTKKFAGQDYRVCHLEGQWWGKQETGDFSTQPQATWNWRLMIRVPNFIKGSDVTSAGKKLKERGKGDDADRVRLETIKEGKCVQMLHVGPYADEAETITRMIEFAKQSGLNCQGRHHEIYLSDPRRVAAAKLRTILRLPVG
jgi:hypothetical protein